MNELKWSAPVRGQDLRIGQGFKALHFAEDQFEGLVDPIVMVDHFHMTAPTFEPHPHAGISAVTYLFEDSTAPHVNYDSLGHHGPIVAGALHWLVAGRGAIHTEQPEGHDPHVHALQIFVNLPASKKRLAPSVVHLEPSDIPEWNGPGARVRVVLGETRGISSPGTSLLPEPFTLLDGYLEPGATFEHLLPKGWCAMVIAIKGAVVIQAQGREQRIECGSALGLGLLDGAGAAVRLGASSSAQFALLSGPALREPMVKQGPFVMNSVAQMRQAVSDYSLGHFGSLRLPV
jgi:redox-sensitive bicupin YhaK (pirin superfamily)